MSTVLFDAPGPRTRRRLRSINIAGTIIVLAALAWVVGALAGKGQLTAQKWNPFLTASPWVDYIIPGLWATIRAAALAVVTSNVFGLLFGIGRLSGNVVIRAVSGVIVEFFRAVPVLVMMIFFYFFFSLSGFVEPTSAPYWGVVAGLTLYNGSVIAELVRSGVLNLPRGQSEAGLSIGLTEGQTLRSILLPQALVAMMPSMISQLVVILKDTALGYLITYSELLRMSRLVGTSFQNLVPALIVAAVIFILINYALTVVAEALARRLGTRTAGAVVVLQTADEGVTPGLDTVHTGPVDPAEHHHHPTRPRHHDR
ncbi:MAG: amino acid ABC transporter permease [Actinomycetes bacterium]|nr:amino acid ABC transporter permease [Actinomycetes bacterium]